MDFCHSWWAQTASTGQPGITDELINSLIVALELSVCLQCVMALFFMSPAELLCASLQSVLLLLLQSAAALSKSTEKLTEAFVESLCKSLFHPEIIICTLIRLNLWSVLSVHFASCCLLTYFCQWLISCPWHHWHFFFFFDGSDFSLFRCE